MVMAHNHDVDGFQERSSSYSTDAVRCDVEQVKGIGGQVSKVSGLVGNAHGKQTGKLAGTGHGGRSLTAAAVARAATSWYIHLQDLASRIATAGVEIVAGANG